MFLAASVVKKALKMAEDVKKCLTTYDPEAAEALRKANRRATEGAAKRCITT